MALQVYAATPRSTIVQNSVWQGIIAKQPNVVCVAADFPFQAIKSTKQRGVNVGFCLKSSLDAVTAVAEVGQVTEVNQDTFWPIVKAAGDKPVVVDMYTQWCGPCKIIAPKYEKLSEEHTDVIFLKLDCNQENKALAKELGIRVVPTFKVLKNGKVYKEVTGAKLDDLVEAIKLAKAT